MPDDKDQLNLGPSSLPNDGQTPELVFNPPPVSPSVPQAPVSPPGSSVNPSSPVSEPASAPTSPPVTPTPSSPGHSGQAQVRAYHSSNPYLNNPKPASEEITRSKPDLDAIFPGQPSSPPLKISSEKQTSPTSRFQAPTSVTPGRPKDYDPKLDNIPKRSTSNQPPLSNENNLTHNINEALNPVKISKPSFSASPPAKQEENKPSSKLEVQSVHTLRADAEVFLKEKNLSLAILAARNKEGREVASGGSGRRSAFLKIMAGVVVLIGVVSLVIMYVVWNLPAEEINLTFKRPDPPQPFYPAYETEIIDLKNTKIDFLGPWHESFKKEILPGRMKALFIYNPSNNRYLSAKDFFDYLDIKVPDILEKTFVEPWTLGILGTIDRKEPVFIIPINNFSNALKGMLEWEHDLPVSIRILLPQEFSKRGVEVFKDILIRDQAVRILENDAGEFLFAYTFFSRNLLIISFSKSSLESIFNYFLTLPPRL